MNNNDVSKKVAQTASCLAPKIFESSLAIVRTALLSKAKHNTSAVSLQHSGELTYESLVKRFGWMHGDFMVECMTDVERTVSESRQLKGKLAPPNKVVTIAVFCWVCSILKVCCLD